jgi:ferrous iron transport protein B
VPSPRRILYDDELQEAVDDLVPLIEAAIPDLPNARWIAMRLIDGCDERLREELANGVLADLAGRIGAGSLRNGMRPDRANVKR